MNTVITGQFRFWEHFWAQDVVKIDDYLELEKMTAQSGDHPRYIGWVPIDRVLAQRP